MLLTKKVKVKETRVIKELMNFKLKHTTVRSDNSFNYTVGPSGMKGESGPNGLRGEMGNKGERGNNGLRGFMGPKGELGDIH